MPNTVTTTVVVAQEEGGSGNLFPTAPKDLSHVTFYFDATPGDFEDSRFFFVKIETPDSVDDDLDHWYLDALDAIATANPETAGYNFLGAALKYGSGKSGGGEFYYSVNDGDIGADDPPTGYLVQGRDFAGRGLEFNYSDLF
jgi:hypothetical protein